MHRIGDGAERLRRPRKSMVRPILIELALFLTPFAVYAIFLTLTRANAFDPESWSWRAIGWLTAVSLLLVILSFVVIAQFSGAPPGSTYIPAHVKDGQFVPGRSE
jgi:hypothetical protein